MAISILIVCEIGTVAAILSFESEIAKAFARGLIQDLDNYDMKPNTTNGISATSLAWDELQSYMKCCGVAEFTDWVLNQQFEETGSVPDSCCKVGKEDCGKGMLMKETPDEIYTEGCLMKCFDVVKGDQLGVSLTMSIIMTVHVGIVVMAFYVANVQKKEKNKKAEYDDLDESKIEK